MYWTAFISAFFSAALGLAAEKKPELIVYTYSSFVSEWGPGKQLASEFEKQCECQITWQSSQSAAELLGRIRLGGRNFDGDVVIGLDQNMAQEAAELKLFRSYQPRSLKWPEFLNLSGNLIPLDYGYLAIMYDSQKIKKPWSTWKSFLHAQSNQKSLIVQDPRTSSPGLALLAWFQGLYGKQTPDQLQKLTSKILTVAPGWSEGYGLFTKGEAPMVMSYTLSEAYHLEVEKNPRYKAMIFAEGHPVQIEAMGILQQAKNVKLAQSFVEYLLSASAQKTIAEKNWMYPVRADTPGLPASFSKLKRPNTLSTPPVTSAVRKKWMRHWQNAFRK